MTVNPFKKVDWIVVLSTFALVTIGLFAIYSATFNEQSGSSTNFNKQLSFALTGLFLMIIVAFFPFRWIQRASYALYAFSILSLILVFFIGTKGFGAERWIYFAGIKFQPAELTKLATVLAVASFVSQPEVDVNRIQNFLIIVAIILLPMILIARQPDLGTSLVFLALLIPLLFWAGLSWFALFVIVSPLVTLLVSFTFYAFLIWMIIISVILALSKRKMPVMVSIFLFHILVGSFTPVMWSQLRPYQQQRILTFANPESDPRGAGYQIIQSKVAIGSGGFWGKGFLNGSQTQLKFLPAQHTDFIFSVIGEEWGFWGVVIILAIYLVFLLYVLHLAVQVRSNFASMALIGIITIFFFHIIINIGMTVGLAPVTGLPLPFISYGGSFLLVTLLMVGLVLNFSANRFEQ